MSIEDAKRLHAELDKAIATAESTPECTSDICFYCARKAAP